MADRAPLPYDFHPAVPSFTVTSEDVAHGERMSDRQVFNSFGMSVKTLLSEGFPNLKFVVDFRYAQAAGNTVQLIAGEFDGNDVGFCGFTEKQRDHRVIAEASAYRQKKTGGSWGAVIKYPVCISTTIGV